MIISGRKKVKRLKKLFWNISGGRIKEKWRVKIIIKIVNEGANGA